MFHKCYALMILMVASLAACTHEPEEESLYFPKIKIIIRDNCETCHRPGGQGLPIIFETDEDITSRAAAIKRTTLDPASPQNKRMPQVGSLSDQELDNILRWFEKGGKSTD